MELINLLSQGSFWGAVEPSIRFFVISLFFGGGIAVFILLPSGAVVLIRAFWDAWDEIATMIEGFVNHHLNIQKHKQAIELERVKYEATLKKQAQPQKRAQ
jgi:hypothetical protein